MIDIHWLGLVAYIAIAFCVGWAAAMIRANRQLAKFNKQMDGCLAAADDLNDTTAVLRKSIAEVDERVDALRRAPDKTGEQNV